MECTRAEMGRLYLLHEPHCRHEITICDSEDVWPDNVWPDNADLANISSCAY